MVNVKTKPRAHRVKITTARQIPVPTTSEQAHVVQRKGVHGMEHLVVQVAKLPRTVNVVQRVRLITRVLDAVQAKTLPPAAALQSKALLTNFGLDRNA